MNASVQKESSDSKTESRDSIGCELISILVKSNQSGGVKGVARPAGISPDTVKTWALHRRKPGFDQLAELMVYHDSLLEGFLDHIKTRRAECQKT